MKQEPNWDRIGEIAQEAKSLKHAGRLDYATFRRMLAEVEAASNGNRQHVNILSSYANIDWVNRLYREEQDARKKKRSVA